MSTVSVMRPGVYASYTVTGGYTGGTQRMVGVIAASPTGEKGKCKVFTRLNDVFAEYGSDTEQSSMAALVKLLFLGRVGGVYCVCVGESPTQSDYEAAYALLEETEIGALVCDAGTQGTIIRLGELLMQSAGRLKERIGFFGVPQGEAPHGAARAVNCERVVLTAPAVTLEGGQTAGAAYLAAACCAAVLAQGDPAANLNLTQVEGNFGFPAEYSEEEITALLSAGVTVLEQSGGKGEIIRALTTKTAHNGAPDLSLRELSTMRIIDDVVQTVRALLKRQLRGAKNNAATRDALRTQTACELSKKLAAGIIDSYTPPLLYPKEGEPTVCVAEIGFAVVYGIHRIEILAHISV